MSCLRDQLVVAALISAGEAYFFLQVAPHLKPLGGLGRLVEWFLIANTVVLLTYRWMIYPLLLSSLRHIPGPAGGNIFWGHGAVQFSRPPGEMFKKWANAIPNDGLLRFRGFFNTEFVIPTSHETLKQVIHDNAYDYVKPAPVVEVLRKILGNGLILVEGDVHKFQRKHLLPSFQVKHIRELYPMFWAKSCEMIGAIQRENGVTTMGTDFEFEFGEWCMRSTLDIIGIAGFGRDFGAIQTPHEELIERYTEVLEPSREKAIWFGLNVILPPRLIALLPWKINKQVKANQKTLYSFAINMVRERRAEFVASEKSKSSTVTDPATVNERNDILSLLVRSNDFSDHELADQVLTMMAAGHETTSSALSWCTFLLAKHPDIQTRLRDEIRTALTSPDTPSTPLPTISAATIDALPLLNATCLEVLRLYPTVPVTTRENIRPTPLAGHILPVGTRVLLAPWAINRSTHFWGPDAEEFRPERWLSPPTSGSTMATVNRHGGASSNYAQLTFLHGPRSCIGQGFAQSELKCLLAAFVARFHVALARDEEGYVPAGVVTTKPRDGMWLKAQVVPGW